MREKRKISDDWQPVSVKVKAITRSKGLEVFVIHILLTSEMFTKDYKKSLRFTSRLLLFSITVPSNFYLC